jgi:hypothetical protein
MNTVLLAVTAETTGTSTAANALIMVLVILGAIALFRLESNWRMIAIVVIIGILGANIKVIRDLGSSLRGWSNDQLVRWGAPELVGEAGFTLLLLLAFIGTGGWYGYSRKKNKGDGSKPAFILFVITGVLLGTLSWFSELIQWLGDKLSSLLTWLQGIGL